MELDAIVVRALSSRLVEHAARNTSDPADLLRSWWLDPMLAAVISAPDDDARTVAAVACHTAMARVVYEPSECSPAFWRALRDDEVALQAIEASETALDPRTDPATIVTELAVRAAAAARAGGELDDASYTLMLLTKGAGAPEAAAALVGVEGLLEDHPSRRRYVWRIRGVLVPLAIAHQANLDPTPFVTIARRALAGAQLSRYPSEAPALFPVPAMVALDADRLVLSRGLATVFAVAGAIGPVESRGGGPSDPATWDSLAQKIDQIGITRMIGPCEFVARALRFEPHRVREAVVALMAEAQIDAEHIIGDGEPFVGWDREEVRRQDRDTALADAWSSALQHEAPSYNVTLVRAVRLLAPELARAGVTPANLGDEEDDGALLLDTLAELVGAWQALARAGHQRDADRVWLAVHALGWAGAGNWFDTSGWSADGEADAAIRLLASGWPLVSTSRP